MRQVNVKSFLSILEKKKKNVVSKVLIYNSDNTVWQSLTNSHYQILGLNIVRYYVKRRKGSLENRNESEVS